MKKKSIKITVLTVNYCNRIGLENTIKSVVSQDYDNIEFIIIDGLSNDGSLEIIKKYKKYIHFYISEKDQGIYYAMNKGINYCNGDFLIFLNSGDSFHKKNVLSYIVKHIDDFDTIYFGRANTIADNISWLFPPTKISENDIHNWRKKACINVPNHQAMFFPKNFYKNNYYNTNFNIDADADFKIRAFKAMKARFIECIIVNFTLGGLSNASNNFFIVNKQLRDNLMLSLKYDTFLIKIKMLFYLPLKCYVKYILKKIYKDNYYKILSKMTKYND